MISTKSDTRRADRRHDSPYKQPAGLSDTRFGGEGGGEARALG